MASKKPRYDIVRMDIRFNSPWDIEREVPDAELRRVYSSLRSTFNKRINTLLRSEFGNIPEIQWAATAFPTLKEAGYTRSELAFKTNQLLRFLDSPSYSVTGRRETERQTIQTLNRIGFTNVNKGNIRLFGQFMDYARTIISWALDVSDKVAELANDFLGEKEDANISEWADRLDAWIAYEAEAKSAADVPGNFRKPKERRKKR